MRFITEFELPYPYTLNRPEAHIEHAKHEMGRLIQEVFDWKEKDVKICHADGRRWTLEIEAFPMDKWIEFKKLLLAEFEGSYIDVERMRVMIEELESHGK